MRTKWRLWLLRKLDGVDRQACVDFCDKWLGEEATVLTSEQVVVSKTFIRPLILVGDYDVITACTMLSSVAIAPWASYNTIAGCILHSNVECNPRQLS